MSKQVISVISIIPLVLGTMLMLATGFGLLSSKNLFFAGLTFFAIFGLFEGISRKLT